MVTSFSIDTAIVYDTKIFMLVRGGFKFLHNFKGENGFKFHGRQYFILHWKLNTVSLVSVKKNRTGIHFN